jgi:phosphoglycolate phosphatase
MPGPRYRLAIFDFDGTLADSLPWFAGILNEVAVRYGFRTLDAAEMEALRGEDNRAIVRALGVPAWKIPLIANHMRRLVARDAGLIRLFPGVGDLFAGLAAGGMRVAVVTSNAEENVRRILGPANAALVDHFGCGASLFGKPRKICSVLKASGLGAADAIAIGDEVRDIEAAAAAGVAAGAVTWGYARPDLLRSRGPTLVFDSVGEIAERLAPGGATPAVLPDRAERESGSHKS